MDPGERKGKREAYVCLQLFLLLCSCLWVYVMSTGCCRVDTSWCSSCSRSIDVTLATDKTRLCSFRDLSLAPLVFPSLILPTGSPLLIWFFRFCAPRRDKRMPGTITTKCGSLCVSVGFMLLPPESRRCAWCSLVHQERENVMRSRETDGASVVDFLRFADWIWTVGFRSKTCSSVVRSEKRGKRELCGKKNKIQEDIRYVMGIGGNNEAGKERRAHLLL